jgi:hypothetical protein
VLAIGTPGCTGGGADRTGALYTGRGPVCGTIMRGAGGGAAAGRIATAAAGGALAETTGGAAAGGACAAGDGVSGRTGGALAGDDVVVDDAAGGATTRAGTTGVTEAAAVPITGFIAGGAATGRLTPAGATTGFSAGGCVTGGATARGAGGAATASFRCVIAFSTSPGREMFERSIFVLISSSPRNPRELDLPAGDEPSAEERRYTRTFSASCSSRELECVFFSVTPTSARVSRIALLLTSSSRARSLIRTLLIRPFVSPCCS